MKLQALFAVALYKPNNFVSELYYMSNALASEVPYFSEMFRHMNRR